MSKQTRDGGPALEQRDYGLIAYALEGTLWSRGWKALRNKGLAVVIQGRNTLTLPARDAFHKKRRADAMLKAREASNE